MNVIVNPESIAKFEAAPLYRNFIMGYADLICTLCDHAKSRSIESNHPIMEYWSQHCQWHRTLARIHNAALAHFRELEDINYGLGGRAISQKCSEQFDRVVDELMNWIAFMMDALAHEGLEGFIENEIALIAP